MAINCFRLWMIIVSAILSAPLIPNLALAEERNPVEGFYLGGFAGVVVLDSTVVFPATTTRPSAKYVDQGGDGFALGLRAGWGQLLPGNIYGGVEVEGVYPHNVTSRLNAMGMEYRVRMRPEVGLFGRFGWTADGRNLLYVRGGLTIPRQNYESVKDGADVRADWTPVPAVGVGSEIALNDRVAARIDLLYSFPHGTNVLESYRMMIGISYRF